MTFCRTCGKEIATSAFCSTCGTPAGHVRHSVPPASPASVPLQQTTTSDKPTSRILLGLLLLDTLFAIIGLLPLFADFTGGGFQRVQFWLGILTAITWLWWLRNAHQNLRRRGIVPTQSGVVLCWFVPLLNLIRPYEVVRELWTNSGAKNLTVIQIWWIASIGWFCLKISGFLYTGDMLFQEFQWASAVDFGIRLTLLASSMTACMIVAQVSSVKGPTVGDSATDFAIGIATQSFNIPLLGAAGIGVAALVFLLSAIILEPSPEQSLRELGVAYMRHDLNTYRSYFNTKAVLDNAVERTLTSEIVTKWTSEKTGISRFGVGIFAGIAARLLERYYTPGLAERIDSGLVLGVISDPRVYDNRFGLEILKGGIIAAESIRLWVATNYQGAEVVQRFGRSALVRIDFKHVDERATRPISVITYMIRVRNHWQIVAISDVDGLIQQIPNTAK